MPKYYLLLLVICLFTNSHAQDMEKLMTKRFLDCRDIAFNTTLLIPEYFAKNNTDTVGALISYWEKNCGVSEPLLRLKILLAINADTLNENIYSKKSVINYATYYRDRVRSLNDYYTEYGHHYAESPINASYNNFTKDLALKLRQNNYHTELEKFFLDLYSNNFDNLFLRLQDSSLAKTELNKAYNREIERELKKTDGHFAIYSGLWIPNGNLKILGNHPIIGVQGGFKNRKGLMFDVVMEIKFANSPNTYFVRKHDSLYATKHFFGGYFGAELGYELLNYKMHEFNVLGGVGFDGFDALEIGKPNDPNRITESINSLNLNIGFGYRKYFKNKTYMGIDTRYNFVNYHNRNGTDLSGNTITVRLKFGISRNFYRDKNLLRLDYKKILTNKKYYEWLKNEKEFQFY